MASLFAIRSTNPAKTARDKRDAELNRITTEACPMNAGEFNIMKWEVKRGGVLIGFVEQFRKTSTETFPVQAMPLQWNRQTTMVGAFYGPNGFSQAVAAVANFIK